MHTTAVTAGGDLYTWGCGLSGQLGFESASVVSVPTKVSLPGAGTSAWLVACGAAHTLVVSSTGQLFGFGANNVGQLGIARTDDTLRVQRPKVVAGLAEADVVAVACGPLHSCVQTASGSVFAFGKGLGGRLGTGQVMETDVPTAVRALEGQRIVQMACGEAVTCFLTGTENPRSRV
jgi:alpha-tubulin suppressor-like RCC1 family protein